MSGLEGLGLDEWLITSCKTMGIKKPFPIQTNCIPPILDGVNVVGCAKTGSGKTAAFALPILQKLSVDRYGIYALVLSPTIELAFQIADHFKVFGKDLNIDVQVICGGQSMVQEGLDLNIKPHIVVSTPGRLADHLQSCDTFSLKKIKFLVLDEADRLLGDELDCPFGEQLEVIFKRLPKKRQTLLFSATITPAITQMSEASEEKVFSWTQTQTSDIATVDELDQRYVIMNSDVKDAFLIHILDKFTTEKPNSSIIVFTETCKNTQVLAMVCEELGFPCVSLHGLLSQKLRLSALSKFKSHKVKILFATDVASRGLDIPMVDLIINENTPECAKIYVHRVGRTARAGRGGMAVTLVTQFDVKRIKAIESFINTKLVEHETDEGEIMKLLTEVTVARREAEIKLEEEDFGEKKERHKRIRMIMEGKDPDAEEESWRKVKKMKKKLKSEMS